MSSATTTTTTVRPLPALGPNRRLKVPKQAERTLLSGDAAAILRTAAAFGVTHLAVDRAMREEYGEDRISRLDAVPVYRKVFSNSALLILEIRPP